MHAFKTSVQMNSRMSEVVSVWRLNSGIMDRNTRSTTPQQRVSRIRIACVQKRIRGSRIRGELRQNVRIDGHAEGCLGGAVSPSIGLYVDASLAVPGATTPGSKLYVRTIWELRAYGMFT
jgi:hypothetical protein